MSRNVTYVFSFVAVLAGIRVFLFLAVAKTRQHYYSIVDEIVNFILHPCLLLYESVRREVFAVRNYGRAASFSAA